MDPGDSAAGSTWYKDEVSEDWTGALETAKARLMTSSTRTRLEFLRDELLPLSKHGDELSLSQMMDIFKLLTQTYPKYVDSASREAVEDVGIELVRQDELRETKLGVTEQVLGWMANEVGRISRKGSPTAYASADTFVLLSWTCGIYTVCVESSSEFTDSRLWNVVVGSMAMLLDHLLSPASRTKPSLRKATLIRVRRALRSSPGNLDTLISTLLSAAKANSAPLTLIPLLGTAVDVKTRLKNVKDESLKELSPDAKAQILTLYANSVIMAKGVVPVHVSNALNDFFCTCVSQGEFETILLPSMEKALLRSPEYSLNVISDFFNIYSHPLAPDEFRRIVTPTLSAAKSSNALVRAASVSLFNVVASKIRPEDSAAALLAVTEILSLPKAGKTNGPDHRVALYSMLLAIPPSAFASSTIVQAGPGLLIKETHDAATSVLSAAVTPHLVFMLRENMPIPAEAVNVITKEMASSKPAVRRAFFSLVGNTIWELGELSTDASAEFAQSVLPALENGLKNVAANPSGSVGGPLEGYIPTALLLGPYLRSEKYGDVASKNAVIQGLSSSAKPSFLASDKVYQRLTGTEDEAWLLRASQVSLPFLKTQLSKNELLRVQLGSIFIHLAVDGQSPTTRRSALATLERLAAQLPEVVNRMMRDALIAFLSKDKPPIAKTSAATEDGDKPAANKQPRLASLLYTCASFKEDVLLSTKQSLLADLVILGHHPSICGKSRQTWVDLCQRAGADPNELVNTQLDKLLKLVLDASNSSIKGFPEASYYSVTTLAFVSPESVLPRIMEQLLADINPADINSLSAMDLGVWATPEGATYVDVLSSATNDQPAQKKGKDRELAMWEAEVRKSIASKKSSGPAMLSKQQQALVQAQLHKESQIRQRVARIKVNLERGLHLVKSLVDADVESFRLYISAIASILIRGALDKGPILVGDRALDAYMQLGNCCSPRLDSMRQWVGIASLRSLEVNGVPEHLRAERLTSLVLRVLYRMRTLSEQAPFDAATYSYASPLLTQVLSKGGVGIEDEDDPGEQIILALEIIKFHCPEFADPAFPRTETMQSLLSVIRQQPKHGKDASSALVDLGEAIHESAIPDNISLLLQGTLSQETYVRQSCLQALQPFDLTDMDWSPELLIASNDEDEQNARLAKYLWDDNGLDVPEAFLERLLPYLGHENSYVRNSTARAFAEAVEPWPQAIGNVVSALEDFYREKAKILAPEFDQYGMVVEKSLGRSDPWSTRVAIGQTFEALAPAFTNQAVEPFFEFLIGNAALGDRNGEVRPAILTAATSVIDLHGAAHLAPLISTFEKRLAEPSQGTDTDDHIKEAVVILLGRVARHLSDTDERVPVIVNRLVEALKTPAEQVQIAVSDCLAPLVKTMHTSSADLVSRLLDELFSAPKYASRRGAAYGLAGVIKGLGISSMKEFNVLPKLRAAAEDKKKYEPRQGAMFAFETMSNTLGRLFEPYVIHILPTLLGSFGDSVPEVREAAQETARAIMANMSGYGLKTILPDLLSGLEEKQWRTKKGSIELLGMMAYCSPRQLSLSLPIVIPQLTGVLTDSHAQVRAAADRSLKQFGEVISNPEIQNLVPILLKALVDPERTPRALTSLLKTSFMHFIDHSSLALIIPIIERGLRERGADTKKKAARIVGNLASLTDSKDFVPYLPRLLPMIHVVLVDPVPEARATAAKSLGALVERLGEVNFPDLVPGLLRTLKTDTSGVDRQGAAQGLSEVLSGLGMERMEGLLPDIIVNAQSPRSTVREGFMSLLVFLPATFGTRFQPHLPKIISPILSGLADTEEYVREAAMRAGRMIVTNYSTKAIDLLLPELERGIFDPGWRIRQSSITLVGELLFKVSGISGKAEIGDEDEEVVETAAADSSKRALAEVLGIERRDHILAALYLARQDAVNVVRQSSIHIWKALVSNTPRTVREILPELIGQIITLLSSNEFEQQDTASRTMGDLCRKAGEKVLAEIVSTLRTKATSPDARTREGVCIAIGDLVENTSDPQREQHEDDIISMVRVSLVDDDSNVRGAAAKAFDVLQEYMGAKAIDQTIPTLLDALRQPGNSSGTALQALKEVMSVRASTVFPVLIPTLTTSPMSIFNARALATLVTVAGSALSKRLTVLLNALVREDESINDAEGSELKEAIDEALRALLGSISDPEGLNTLMMLLLGWARHDSPRRRVSACNLFAFFCEETELDTSLYRVDWIRQLISLLDDRQPTVHKAAWSALDIFVKAVPKDELEPLVVPLRRTIESTGAPGHYVPGFSLPKGVAPTVPIIIAGLTTGSNEQREQAAYAIGDLVERTEESAIKPFVVPFTGPLIRVATQATTYPPGVKTGILSALKTMLERIPAFVKPFFPQLQRTFVKSASDPSSLLVRTRAAEALGVLMKNQPRVDPVVAELITAVKTNDEEVAGSLVLALANVAKSGGSNLGDKAKESCIELLTDAFRESHHEHYNNAAAALFAGLSAFDELVQPLIDLQMTAGTPPSALASQCILAVLSEDAPSEESNIFQRLGILRTVAQKVQESVGNERPAVARPAREARELLRALDDEA